MLIRILSVFLSLSLGNLAHAATRVDLQKGSGFRVLSHASLQLAGPNLTTTDGNLKVKYRQVYRGIPVWGESPIVGEFPVHTDTMDSQTARWVHGTYVEGIAQDLGNTKSAQSPEAIRQILQTLVPMASAAELADASIQLFIQLDDQSRAHLVYHASLVTQSPKPSRPHFVLEANTGAVLQHWEGLTTRHAAGVGGNPKMGKHLYGERDLGHLSISDACAFQNENVRTYDLKNGYSRADLEPFQMQVCPMETTPFNESRMSNDGYSPVNDGHFYGGLVFDMYTQWYQMRPLSQNLTVHVHYGKSYENAHWDGKVMTFGDGATTFYPLVSLGIMAHEVSHGVTEQNSGLVYFGHAGGLNESFSDMAAQAAEEFYSGTASYQVGGEVMKKPNDFLRDLAQPTRDGRSIEHASAMTPRMDPHYSSGVYNKAFTLLAKSEGWSAKKAFHVFLTANRMYWKAQSTFNEAACGAELAAKDLGYDPAQVAAHLETVGVTCLPVPPPQPEPGEPSPPEEPVGT